MAEAGSGTKADESQSPWLRSGFVLAVTFLGFVAVIGAVVLLAPGSSGSSGGGAEATPEAAASTARSDGGGSSSSGSAGAAGGQCRKQGGGSGDGLDAAPSGVKWELFGTVALPRSKSAGPAVVDGDVARCYAHTPVGALLATSQISARHLAADDWLKVTKAQTVGAGKRSYIAARRKYERGTGRREAEADGAAQGQIAGFRFVTYTADTAVIQTVWRFSDGKMQAATTTVLWRGGDWRLEYPASPTAPTAVDSLAGYVKWGGV